MSYTSLRFQDLRAEIGAEMRSCEAAAADGRSSARAAEERARRAEEARAQDARHLEAREELPQPFG